MLTRSCRAAVVHKPRGAPKNGRSCALEPVLKDDDNQDEVDMLASDDDLNDLDLQLLALAEDDKTKRRKKKRARAKARQAGVGDNDKKRMSLSDLPKEVLKNVSAALILLLSFSQLRADCWPRLTALTDRGEFVSRRTLRTFLDFAKVQQAAAAAQERRPVAECSRRPVRAPRPVRGRVDVFANRRTALRTHVRGTASIPRSNMGASR